MALIYWGQVNAASDMTMSTIVDTSGTRTRQSIIGLITPVAAGIIAGNPTIIAAAEQAAQAAVEAALLSSNIVQAFPDGNLAYSTETAVPMQWMRKTLSDPYSDTYSDVYSGTYLDNGRRWGRIPVLTEDGKIADIRIPDWVANKADIPDVPDIPVFDAPFERNIRPEFPILGARIAKSRQALAPAAVVITGSSTSAADPGYIERLTPSLQATYVVTDPSAPQWSDTGTFNPRTGAGVHVYSAGKSGANASNYLPNDVCARIAALVPAAVVHMIGANDYYGHNSPSAFKTLVEGRIAYLRSLMSLPCQHILVQSYPRWGTAGSIPDPYPFPWADYLDAFEQIAAAAPDVVVIDLSEPFAAVGVSESDHSDPLDLISSDDVHQTPAGYEFMADALAVRLVG